MVVKPRLLFYFLHLLGVGHVYRAKRLIEGLAARGFAVDVIYGGTPLPDMTFAAESVHMLSPISAVDSTYSAYVDAGGNPLTKEFQDQRTEELCSIFDTLQPDIILTEAYPFGRRMVRYELKAMLELAKARKTRPTVVSSVRDILQERKKPERVEETVGLIDDYFDHVLVHSDPAIIQLDETFPLTNRIADKVSYTGFVVPSGSAEQSAKAFDVIVSAGGGAFGKELMETAWTVAQQRKEFSWCFAVGTNVDAELLERFTDSNSPHITVVSRLENLAAHMKKARLSISQCGYNTAMDVLVAHRDSTCRAIFVPFDTQGQTEQARRAELLERSGYAINLPQSRLTVNTLNNAIDDALVLKKVEHDVNFDGVANSAEILMSWVRKT